MHYLYSLMQDEQHISIKELAAKLSEGIEAMGSGDTSKEGVHELQDVARELYERLTVLRFKAFENKVEEVEIEEEEEEEDENQIDLIDSIAEVSLAEKHLNKPLSSISEGLTILEIANYTSILFKNDGTKFNETLDAVDGCGGREEAYKLFQAAISPEGHEEDIAHARVSFENRIQRLYSE